MLESQKRLLRLTSKTSVDNDDDDDVMCLDGMTKEQQFVHMIAHYMDTIFTSPEEEIIKQGNDVDFFYIIITGDCIVNIRDMDNYDHVAYRLLVEGNHFGEIGLIYNCKRTCTVVSRNFNTLGSLNRDKFLDILNKYPYFKQCLKKHIFKYKDPNIQFLKKPLQKVSYFQNMTREQ